MRRWNGWGDESVDYPLPPKAAELLTEWIGPGDLRPDVEFDELVAQVPESRLPEHPLVDREPAVRLLHARGQSLPDWVAVRCGMIDRFPDGVAFPEHDADVRTLLRFAAELGAHVIPYGGGTSVAGHINPLPADAPVLTVDMRRMNQLRSFHRESQLATFGAGVSGPDLEAQLRVHGSTLGHYPQSFEYSTLGGWVATRSSGQQSIGYGRIEELFAGGRLEAPVGTLVLPDTFPASAAGPDLRELVLGSEGRLGVLTEVTVRARPLPEEETFTGIFFPSFEAGRAAVHEMAQAELPLSLLRLSTAVETQTTLALAGRARLIGALERLLSLRGVGSEKAMLLVGFTGQKRILDAAQHEVDAIADRWEGVGVGRTFGRTWQKSRFHTPYLRNALWDHGYAVDTLETAVSWERVPSMVSTIEDALRGALTQYGEAVHLFTHLSHVYPSGSSVYTTFIFRLAPDPEETLQRWQGMKQAASEAITQLGGTISHQHGVGRDHLPYLEAEKGELGLATLRTLQRQFDPAGIMNPGKLIG